MAGETLFCQLVERALLAKRDFLAERVLPGHMTLWQTEGHMGDVYCDKESNQIKVLG